MRRNLRTNIQEKKAHLRLEKQKLMKCKTKVTHDIGNDNAETTTKTSNNNEGEPATPVNTSVTDDLETFECYLCSINLTSEYILEVHRKVFHENKCYSCHLCDKEFEESRQLTTHIKTFHPKQNTEDLRKEEAANTTKVDSLDSTTITEARTTNGNC